MNRVSVEYIMQLTTLVGEHAFPPTMFAVACLGCSLHLVAAVG